MDLIWYILPFALYVAGGLLSMVLSGAIVGGRLSRSWVAKAAPRLLVVGLVVLLLAPTPPPVAAAVLGYAGLAVFGMGWLLKGRVAAIVQVAGVLMLLAARLWTVWFVDGRDEVLRWGMIFGGLWAGGLLIYAIAAWFERRADARAGEGA
ncbi:hypothetical protein [Caulobacter sp. BE254]|uniref:hypothetical protein n=1 Tax=Caulobacter sp. BE254 TaxID=2817720 RepID=UPI002857150C|nr:hypothetical protein [Caulobacter sp. BE254]MDR7116446.1 hypothetical protein [Caulobacter sp. BE254]